MSGNVIAVCSVLGICNGREQGKVAEPRVLHDDRHIGVLPLTVFPLLECQYLLWP